MRYLLFMACCLAAGPQLLAFNETNPLLAAATQAAASSNWDSTAIYLEQIKTQCQAEDNLSDWMAACKKVARAADDMGLPFRAIEYFSLGADPQQFRSPKDSLEWDALGWLHVNIAFTYYQRVGQFAEALEHYRKAKQIIVDDWGVEDYYVGRYIYKTMGNIYTRYGDYQAGEVLLKKYIAISESVGANRDVAQGWCDLAAAYYADGQFEQAQLACEKGLQIPGLGNDTRGILWANLSLALEASEQYEASIALTNTALATLKAEQGQASEGLLDAAIGNIHIRQGNIYLRNQDYQRADQAFQLGFAAYQAYFETDKNREISKIHNRWGALKYEQNDWTGAIAQYQKALACIIPNFELTTDERNPTRTQLFAENSIQEALLGKALALEKRFEDTQKKSDLELALQSHQLIFEVEQALRKTHNYEASRLNSVEETRERCEAAIRVALRLWEVTQNPAYQFTAFEFAERSKSILLLQATSAAKAVAVANIPASKLKEEKALQYRITNLEKQLFGQPNLSDSLQLALENELLELRQAYTLWQDELETEYATYYQLKYNLALPDLATIRSNILRHDQALIEYFVGNETVYAFYIDQEQFEVIQWDRPEDLADMVVQFRADIEQFQFSSQDRTALCDSYTQKAVRLHDELLGRLPNLPTDLLIIPSGILGFLPFEALLTTAPAQACAFESYPYVLKTHCISYSYSLTLQQLLQAGTQSGQADYIGYAPRFDGSAGWGKLANNTLSVDKAAAHFGGQAKIAGAANIRAFQETAPRYEIIQLATHATANTQNADFSCILFSDGANSYDTLFVKDLYLMELEADLVVLSACETAIGKLYQGEGIISLARAFLYAGAKSVVTTLWQINDDATGELLDHFYVNLKNGEDKATALRAAKLSYLEENKSLYAHPVYWAGFTPIGNMKPIYAKHQW
ncbi:MAG: CHAT domain-containing protein, partial [Bacteroidota bacterium]